MLTLRASLWYFSLVFGAGFVLGTIRVLWLVPRVGVRAAELLEAPVMLVAIVVCARWVMGRFAHPPGWRHRLLIGALALALLLAAEFTLVLGLRGMSLGAYLASRDPVAGTAYGVMLLAFALMPLLVVRR